jgi:hypothetical protein
MKKSSSSKELALILFVSNGIGVFISSVEKVSFIPTKKNPPL